MSDRDFDDNEPILSMYMEQCGKDIIEIKSGDDNILRISCVLAKDHVSDCSINMEFRHDSGKVTITITKENKK